MHLPKSPITLFLPLAFLLISQLSFAQTIGVRGGMNIARFAYPNELFPEEMDFQHRNSYHTGIAIDLPLSNNFLIETGLNVSGKGTKTQYKGSVINGGSYEFTHKYRTTYLDVPLALKWKTDNSFLNFYGLLGGYAGIGLHGKILYEIDPSIEKIPETIISWGKTEDDNFRRPDYGALLGAGIQIGSVQLGVSYLHGLASILSLNPDEHYFRNRVLQLSATFYFLNP